MENIDDTKFNKEVIKVMSMSKADNTLITCLSPSYKAMMESFFSRNLQYSIYDIDYPFVDPTNMIHLMNDAYTQIKNRLSVEYDFLFNDRHISNDIEQANDNYKTWEKCTDDTKKSCLSTQIENCNHSFMLHISKRLSDYRHIDNDYLWNKIDEVFKNEQFRSCNSLSITDDDMNELSNILRPLYDVIVNIYIDNKKENDSSVNFLQLTYIFNIYISTIRELIKYGYSDLSEIFTNGYRDSVSCLREYHLCQNPYLSQDVSFEQSMKFIIHTIGTDYSDLCRYLRIRTGHVLVLNISNQFQSIPVSINV